MISEYIPLRGQPHGLAAYDVFLKADQAEVNEHALKLLGMPEGAEILGSILLIQMAVPAQPLDQRLAATLAGDLAALEEFDLLQDDESEMGTLSEEQQQKALAIVAQWTGPRLGHDGPAPTDEAAYEDNSGIVLVPAWVPHWGDGAPVPTILHEGLNDWAIHVSDDANVSEQLRQIGVFCEPLTEYALGLYPYIF